MVFIISCLIIFNVVAYLIPKRLSRIEIYSTSVFALVFGITTDVVLDLHYRLYGYLYDGFQWIGLISEYLYFPSISIIFLNLFPYTKKIIIKILYFIGWEVFSISFECITVKTNFFYYRGWNIWYSALSYPVIFLILLLNLRVIRHLKRH